MTVNHNELLSALVDGELKNEELDQALQLLKSDEQAIRQFKDYQHASDALHGHSVRNIDVVNQISASLADERVFSLTQETAKVFTFPQRFWKQTASLTIAASIGALAVVGVMNQPENQLIPAEHVAVVEIETTPMVVAKNGERWTVGEQEIETRLNNYLVDHNEYAGASGVFSYARVVSYDMGQ